MKTLFGSKCVKCGNVVGEGGICGVCGFDHFKYQQEAAARETAEAAVASAKDEDLDDSFPSMDDLFPSIPDDE